jgi:histidinol-phosphate/aromatic aminotransferase/cobyric acid decarboxylase-like protein
MIPAGEHGGDGTALARALGIDPDDVLDLSASLNPVAPDPVAPVAAHLGALRRYPDVTAGEGVLAAAMGVDPDRLVLTNGGAEAIALVAAELPRGRVDEPEFSLYRRHLQALDPAGPLWRSNPGNPSGLLAGAGEEAAVWDEAFWPLATGTWTRGDADRGAVVIGSLTKLLACPGLRLGYVLAPNGDAAAAIRRRRPVWSVNGPALGALPDLLAPVDLPKWSAAVADLRDDLTRVLGDAGLRPRPSAANWVLVDAPGLRDRLAPEGILVRDCTSFGLPGTVRVAVPDADGLERLAAALARTGGASR